MRKSWTRKAHAEEARASFETGGLETKVVGHVARSFFEVVIRTHDFLGGEPIMLYVAPSIKGYRLSDGSHLASYLDWYSLSSAAKGTRGITPLRVRYGVTWPHRDEDSVATVVAPTADLTDAARRLTSFLVESLAVIEGASKAVSQERPSIAAQNRAMRSHFDTHMALVEGSLGVH